MDFFVSRESEAIIPNIFFFLVLLSYERYHSKQIIGIPKIIQLCDGIMASGRKAVTHGNETSLLLWPSVIMMCSTVLVLVTPASPHVHNCSVLRGLCVRAWVCVHTLVREVKKKREHILYSGVYNPLR